VSFKALNEEGNIVTFVADGTNRKWGKVTCWRSCSKVTAEQAQNPRHFWNATLSDRACTPRHPKHGWLGAAGTVTWLQESANCHGKLIVACAPPFSYPANSLSPTKENSREWYAGVVIGRDFQKMCLYIYYIYRHLHMWNVWVYI